MASERPEQKVLRAVFEKYASLQKDDRNYMTGKDFICTYLSLVPEDSSEETIAVLTRSADTTGDGLISFEEYCAFETLLRRPNSVSLLVFRLFDVKRKGSISFSDFKETLNQTAGCKNVPFDYDSSFIKLYFGPKRSQEIDYFAFTQLLQSLPTEHAKQAFQFKDRQGTGSISALDFVDLIRQVRQHKLTEYVDENLLQVMRGEGRRINYAYFKAFNQLLNNLELMEKAFTMATHSNSAMAITMDQLQASAQQFPQITPLQVSLVFEFLNSEKNTGYVSVNDFEKLMPRSHQPPVSMEYTLITQEKRSLASGLLEGVYRFSLAAVGGATGATAVYPIDLVKTRLQNQRGSLAGEILYKNSFDCFRKVIKYEGFFGLYRGLVPQLVGVSPEKAIKLTMNDTVRDFFTNNKGEIPLWGEIIAGGCGGASQVMFTNPIEIVKIRMQVAGEVAGGRVGVFTVLKDLGFFGLYKGVSACLLRDIPFSAIYFPTYAHMKKFTADSKGKNGVASLFISAFLAGVPAAGLLTPADVIKTRLQVKARAGQQTYSGIVDCARKIYKAEGFRAFWKGAPARVFRSSPQFGVTLLTYELLQRMFPVDFGAKKGSTANLTPMTSPQNPDLIGGFSLAKASFAATERQYNLVFPSRPISRC